MASPPRKIERTDIKRWLAIVLAGALAGALEAVGLNIVPELQEFGGATNTAIALLLVLVVDLIRRFFTDTRVVSKDFAEKLVVKEGKEKKPLTGEKEC